MARMLRRSAEKIAGQVPGTAVHVGLMRDAKVTIDVLDYGEKEVKVENLDSLEQVAMLKERPTVTWVNVIGVHGVELIEKIGGYFNLHPLIVEDIVNTSQRPKSDVDKQHVFTVVKMLTSDEKTREIVSEQVSLVLGPTYVISFQERPGDVFDPVRERIRTDKGRIRKMGADYLFYSLLDAVTDGYFAVLEGYEERVDALEEKLSDGGGGDLLREIRDTRRSMIYLRKAVWPLREAVSTLYRVEPDLIGPDVQPYLRDVYDHTIQVIDVIESFRDLITGMQDTYLSNVSNRMNEVMKTLTIIATIFIPLTFLAGVYGMNFRHMPELDWSWGYPGALFVMAVVGVVMLAYFRRKKWL